MRNFSLTRVNWKYFFVFLLIVYLPFLVIVKLHLDQTIELQVQGDLNLYQQNFYQRADKLETLFNQLSANVNDLVTQAGVKRGLEVLSSLEDQYQVKVKEFLIEQEMALVARDPFVKAVRYSDALGNIYSNEDEFASHLGEIFSEKNRAKATELGYHFINLKTHKVLLVPIHPNETSSGLAFGAIFLNVNDLASLDQDQSFDWGIKFNDQVTLEAQSQTMPMAGDTYQTFSRNLSVYNLYYREDYNMSQLTRLTRDQINSTYFYYILISLVSISLLTLSFYLMLEHRKMSQVHALKLEMTEQHNQKLRIYRHDVMNHLQVITGLIEVGTKDKALAYIRQLSRDASFTQGKYELGIPEVEMLVFNYIKKTKDQGIGFDMTFSHIEDFTLDVFKVNTIIGNLMKNAFEATSVCLEKHKNMSIAFTEVGLYYRIEVFNSHPLIPDQLRDKIFEEGESTKGEGRGLGLFIVSEIVKEMGGMVELRVQSAGNTFIVMLPKTKKI